MRDAKILAEIVSRKLVNVDVGLEKLPNRGLLDNPLLDNPLLAEIVWC